MLCSLNRRIALACLLSTTVLPAIAQPYPAKPVRLIVAYSAGGPIDALARALAVDLGALWQQSVVVDNRPGANELIGAQALVQAPADGYTLMLHGSSTASTNSFLLKRLPYDPEKDLVPITNVATTALVLAARKDMPFSSVKELVAYARQHPGKVTYASSGTGNITHLVMEAFARKERIELVHVPYKGAAPALQDLLGGSVDLTLIAVSAVAPQIANGNVKGLAVGAPQRTAKLPGVPTFEESGAADPGAYFYTGLVAPRGTPDALVQKIAHDVRAVVSAPGFIAKSLAPFGMVGDGRPPADYRRFLAEDRQVIGQRIRDAGIQPE
jgi:tripartite-type tricarboxylate transporter receptor subunit TctC